jgi:hypothetical protein
LVVSVSLRSTWPISVVVEAGVGVGVGAGTASTPIAEMSNTRDNKSCIRMLNKVDQQARKEWKIDDS